MVLKICHQCGKEFNTEKKNKKFCSRSCASESLKKEPYHLICQWCGKEFTNRSKHAKFCCTQCNGKHNAKKSIVKQCEYCGKDFTTTDYDKRFCNTSCSAKWRVQTYGVPPKSEQAIEKMRQASKKIWENPDFRASVVKRMKENNPAKNHDTMKKIINTARKNGSYKNRFNNCGNGKISEAESIANSLLEPLGFLYNYPIATKLARDRYPDRNYAKNYKPDFFNPRLMLAIEIDGSSHKGKEAKELDDKKESCLTIFGISTIRFSNDTVKNDFDKFKEATLDEISKKSKC